MVKEKIKKTANKTAKTPKKEPHPLGKLVDRLYSKSAPLLMFEALLFIVAATLIFIKPFQILTTLTLILGVALGLFGLYQIFVGLFGGKSAAFGRTMNVIFGIANLILGIVFFMQPAGSVITVIYIFAILFFVKAIKSIILSVELWKAKFGNYIADMVISICMFILAVLMLFFPRFGAVTAMYYIAVTLLIYAIANINMYVELLRLKKRVS